MGAKCGKQTKPALLPEGSRELQDNLVRDQTREFDDIYEVLEPLGSGAISTVSKIRRKDSALGGSSQHEFVMRNSRRKRSKRRRRSTNIDTGSLRGPQEFFALKEIHSERVTGMCLIRNELEILKTLDHPCIVRAFETFELHHRRLAIVMELCKGGDLFDRKPPFSERTSAIIIRQLLSAISYMHKRNIVHRDIKLENIMFENKKMTSLKVIDFGLSRKYAKHKIIKGLPVGTLYSMAPEALNGVFTTAVDLWSIGVVCYILICGQRPFHGKTDEEMVEKIRDANLIFDAQVWKRRSKECKDFISSLLQKSPYLRPDAETALNHPWILTAVESERSGSTDEAVLQSVRASLVRYSASGDFKRLALNVIAKRLNSDELDELRSAFSHFDQGNDGCITMEEFKEALRGNSLDYSDEDLEFIFKKLDINRNGVITWTEFVAGSLEGRCSPQEHHLADCFDTLDWDDSGYITRDNLRRILGKHYSEEYVKEIIAEVDFKGDGRVSYKEFQRAFQATTGDALQ